MRDIKKYFLKALSVQYNFNTYISIPLCKKGKTLEMDSEKK